ncbi:MAG TPA: DUF4350 domain-containing protein [Ohtaekwangia sp.]
MKKDWKYILYLSLAIGLFVVVKLLSPKQHNWTVTFAHQDQNPFGAYALNQVLPSLFEPQVVRHSYQTLYEIKDSLKRSGSLLVICSSFSGDKEDTKALLKHVAEGGTAFISAHSFWGHFSDTLKVSTKDYLFEDGGIVTSQKDTAYIQMVHAGAETFKRYYFRRDNMHNYFNRFDSTRTMVVAVNDNEKPVTIRVQWGKGNLILNSTPLAFTNIYLLSGEIQEYVSVMLSYLPKENVEWTEYYQSGRMEPTTPLRFILTNEPLGWAYYITILSILIFMLFEMKRRQRIIPVINPLANTTLEFVNTLGNLYYQHGDHKNVAEKKILFLLEQIRTKFWLSTTKLDDEFIRSLAAKSGIAVDQVTELVAAILRIQSRLKISAFELIDLNEKIEKFNQASARS